MIFSNMKVFALLLATMHQVAASYPSEDTHRLTVKANAKMCNVNEDYLSAAAMIFFEDAVHEVLQDLQGNPDDVRIRSVISDAEPGATHRHAAADESESADDEDSSSSPSSSSSSSKRGDRRKKHQKRKKNRGGKRKLRGAAPLLDEQESSKTAAGDATGDGFEEERELWFFNDWVLPTPPPFNLDFFAILFGKPLYEPKEVVPFTSIGSIVDIACRFCGADDEDHRYYRDSGDRNLHGDVAKAGDVLCEILQESPFVAFREVGCCELTLEEIFTD